MKEKNLSVQEWIEIDKILDNGVIKLKKNKYIKIVKVNPINYNLKSDFEKEAILNSYKAFLKTCNFNIQIIIQSNKQDLNNNKIIIENNVEKENKDFLSKIMKEYFIFLNDINSFKSSSCKEFYIVIADEKTNENNIEEIIIEELNEKYYKIKECLLRCGNNVKNINSKKEVIDLLYSFLNTRLVIS